MSENAFQKLIHLIDYRMDDLKRSIFGLSNDQEEIEKDIAEIKKDLKELKNQKKVNENE